MDVHGAVFKSEEDEEDDVVGGGIVRRRGARRVDQRRLRRGLRCDRREAAGDDEREHGGSLHAASGVRAGASVFVALDHRRGTTAFPCTPSTG